VANDLCLAIGMFGLGFWLCTRRLCGLTRHDRKVAKLYLARCRAWGLKTEHIAKGSINNLTLVVSRRLVRQFGRRVATLEAYADRLRRELAEVRQQLHPDGLVIHDAEMEGGLLDEGSTVVLRKEATNGVSGRPRT
jgi:hypothetical protein